jgi:hypothetical protein
MVVRLIRLLLPAAMLATASLGATGAPAGASATQAGAYTNHANWQLGFAGTAVVPGSGSFGFWGWCAFAGVSSGTGDCQVSQYFHVAGGNGFTCEESIDISSFDASGGTFVIEAATVTVRPSRLTNQCLAFFPGPAGFPVDTQFPAAAGHYNFGSQALGAAIGEFQLQVTQLT